MRQSRNDDAAEDRENADNSLLENNEGDPTLTAPQSGELELVIDENFWENRAVISPRLSMTHSTSNNHTVNDSTNNTMTMMPSSSNQEGIIHHPPTIFRQQQPQQFAGELSQNATEPTKLMFIHPPWIVAPPTPIMFAGHHNWSPSAESLRGGTTSNNVPPYTDENGFEIPVHGSSSSSSSSSRSSVKREREAPSSTQQSNNDGDEHESVDTFQAQLHQPYIFRDKYQRNNKNGGKKNLKCFPHCTRHHQSSQTCEFPIRMTYSCSAGHRSSNLEAFSRFICVTEEQNLEYQVDEITELNRDIRIGETLPVRNVARSVKTIGKPLAPLFPGALIQSETHEHGHVGTFEFHERAWHYGWKAGRYRRDMKHCLRFYIFEKFKPDDIYICRAIVNSPEFKIFSSRFNYNKRKREDSDEE